MGKSTISMGNFQVRELLVITVSGKPSPMLPYIAGNPKKDTASVPGWFNDMFRKEFPATPTAMYLVVAIFCTTVDEHIHNITYSHG